MHPSVGKAEAQQVASTRGKSKSKSKSKSVQWEPEIEHKYEHGVTAAQTRPFEGTGKAQRQREQQQQREQQEREQQQRAQQQQRWRHALEAGEAHHRQLAFKLVRARKYCT